MSAKSNFIDADTSIFDNKLRFVKVIINKITHLSYTSVKKCLFC